MLKISVSQFGARITLYITNSECRVWTISYRVLLAHISSSTVGTRLLPHQVQTTFNLAKNSFFGLLANRNHLLDSGPMVDAVVHLIELHEVFRNEVGMISKDKNNDVLCR